MRVLHSQEDTGCDVVNMVCDWTWYIINTGVNLVLLVAK
jgi:hypothetical protein